MSRNLELGTRSSGRPGAKPSPPPDILAYDDYRAFLRDAFAWRKARERGFSYGVLARRAGLSSRSHLRRVLSGELGLSPEAVEKYAEGFKLRGKPAEYFRLLVAANQAKGDAAEAARQALNLWLWEHRHRKLPEAEARGYFGNWENLLVLNLCRMYGAKADPAWISRRLQGRITPVQAREALRYLREKGHLKASGKRVLDAGLKDVFAQWWTPEDFKSVYGRALREAARADGFCVLKPLILTWAEAEDFAKRHQAWIKANLPRRRGKRPKGELFLLMSDLFALSSRSS